MAFQCNIAYTWNFLYSTQNSLKLLKPSKNSAFGPWRWCNVLSLPSHIFPGFGTKNVFHLVLLDCLPNGIYLQNCNIYLIYQPWSTLISLSWCCLWSMCYSSFWKGKRCVGLSSSYFLMKQKDRDYNLHYLPSQNMKQNLDATWKKTMSCILNNTSIGILKFVFTAFWN